MSLMSNLDASQFNTAAAQRSERTDTLTLEADPPREWRLLYIDPQQLGEAWPHINHLLVDVVDLFAGRHTMETVLSEIMNDQVALWVIAGPDGAQAILGTEIGIEPSGDRTMDIKWLAGRGAHKWMHLLEQLEDVARAEGCTRLEMYARKGWAKHMPDYKLTRIKLEKDL